LQIQINTNYLLTIKLNAMPKSTKKVADKKKTPKKTAIKNPATKTAAKATANKTATKKGTPAKKAATTKSAAAKKAAKKPVAVKKAAPKKAQPVKKAATAKKTATKKSASKKQMIPAPPVNENIENPMGIDEQTNVAALIPENTGSPIPQDKYAVVKDNYHGHTSPTSKKSKMKPSGKKPLWNKH
jgi:hypothetical protein